MTIAGPPIFAAKSLKAGEENWQHNWLYSVVPVSERVEDWTNNSSTGIQERVISYPLTAYLTGYCRNCRKTFSEKIPTGSNYMNTSYLETQMHISKYGCVGPEKE